MKNNKLETKDVLVNIFDSKDYDFLYVIKDISNNSFLPKIPKAVCKNMIKSTGLYHICYRLYKNKDGYDAIFISKAAKVMTK